MSNDISKHLSISFQVQCPISNVQSQSLEQKDEQIKTSKVKAVSFSKASQLLLRTELLFSRRAEDPTISYRQNIQKQE